VSDQLKFSSSAQVAEAKRWPTLPKVQVRGLLGSLDWTVVITLALLFVLGLGLRVGRLGAIGFAEDEMNKLNAIHAYERGEFTANGEHPMMMKVFMWGSLHAARALVGAENVSEEAAIRLPNAIFGALTLIPLFLLTAAFFDRWTGLVAAGLWAFGINAITYNRIGKEDTLLVFFMLFAFLFYLWAKQLSPFDVSLRRRHYILSACSFALMLASKYFPHYIGLNALYHHNFRVSSAPKELGEPSSRTPIIFYVVIPVVFLIANPAVLVPELWGYLNAFMGERLLVHSGYLFGGHLYKNTMSGTPFWGTPIYFYLVFMAIKIPIVVLLSSLVGLVVAIRTWRHPGHAFILLMLFFWIVPYSIVGGKWLRYTLSLMPFLYMIAAVGVMTIIRYLQSRVPGRVSGLVAAMAVIVFVGFPALAAYRHGPHFALYTNAFAADKAGYYFPHDEFYDDGLREAIKYVADTAPPGAVIGHETPGVTRYYLEKFNRPDLKSYAMSAPDFDPSKLSGPAFVILQRGRIYFENRDKLAYVQSNFKKVHEVQVDGLTAAEIYRSGD
jgi:hypothetical protein